MAGNAASHAANGVASAAGNSLSNWGRDLLNRIESLFGAQSPAEQFEQVCEHIPVEGVDKLCPYFTPPCREPRRRRWRRLPAT